LRYVTPEQPYGLKGEVKMALSLLKRFPTLWQRTVSWPVIPEKKQNDDDPYPGRGAFPQLAPDFKVLDKEVAPAFTEFDKAALRDQNRYRRQQVIIILGSALVTGLGGLQAVFPHQRWPGFLLAALGIALSATAGFAKDRGALTDYLAARVKAERLRALHFRYLSATGRYAAAGREDTLRRDVLTIKKGEEPK
jgi:hypothetical protein